MLVLVLDRMASRTRTNWFPGAIRASRKAQRERMKLMKTHLWQVSVTTSNEAEEAALALLENLLGTAPSIFADAETQTITVSAYGPGLPRPRAELRARLRGGLRQIQKCGLDIGTTRIAIRRIRRENWAESWKRHFQPLEIGRALLVKPTWSRARPRKGQAAVVLDPGLSFGTGQHPTTAFCLKQLVARQKSGQAQSFLDIGTGSGILAIAAAKLGYHPVQALDFDPAAIRVAKANALLNRVEKRVRIFRQDITGPPLRTRAKFNVICANLTDDVLIGQSKRIRNRLRPDGTLVLAGILRSQFERIRRVYAALGLKLIVTRRDKEWQSGAFACQR